MKIKLIGSGASKEDMEKAIGKYFGNNAPYELREKPDGTFSVHFPANGARAGKQLNKYIVRNKNGRYRFELLIEGE